MRETPSPCVTVYDMGHTLTVRTDEGLQKALRKRAQVQGKTVSGLVREILKKALVERPLSARAGHLKGKLELPREPSDTWSKRIRDRNWRS